MTKVEIGTAVDKRIFSLRGDAMGTNCPPQEAIPGGLCGIGTTNEARFNCKDERECTGLPLVVALNCLEDCRAETEILAGIAQFQHVNLAQISEGKIENAAAVIVNSLAYLPRAAQRRLQPWQLILCLGSIDKSVDSALAADLGLHLVHIDCGRAEEVADTVMALMLGLLRRTHSLSQQGFGSAGWLGSIQPLCRGMRRCRGLVMGIVGWSPAACALAVRCLAFKMKVLYYDVDEQSSCEEFVQARDSDGGKYHWKVFPSAATKAKSLKELLGTSDVISVHCALTNETVQIINADSLHYVKPGALFINTSSCHLLDDCALKQALIEGRIAGCALDGVEGPQWLEAWVRETQNVLILPRSADYSDDVWFEIRTKAFSVLRSYFLDGMIPPNTISEDEGDERDFIWQEERSERLDKESVMRTKDPEQWFREMQTSPQEFHQKQMFFQAQDPRSLSQDANISQSLGHREVRTSKGASKKAKKRAGRRKCQQPTESVPTPEKETNWVALQRDDGGTCTAGRDQIMSSASRFTSPDDAKLKRDTETPVGETVSDKSGQGLFEKDDTPYQAVDDLKEGLVVALRPQDGIGYYVARQKGPGRRWCLDVMSNVTSRDPAAQFSVVLRNKERVGLRSLAAGGKLLQANKKSELVFVNHTFDVWESWVLEGSSLEDCTLSNSKFRSVSLDLSVEVLAAVGEEDGVARWLR